MAVLAGVMLATFDLTVLVDLTAAVGVGVRLAAALFIARMARLTQFDLTDPERGMIHRQRTLEGVEVPPGVAVYSIEGPCFFGTVDSFEESMEWIGTEPGVVLLRTRRVPYMDATAINALEATVRAFPKHTIHAVLSAVQSQPLDMMMRSGITKLAGDANLRPNIASAVARARTPLGLSAGTTAAPRPGARAASYSGAYP